MAKKYQKQSRTFWISIFLFIFSFLLYANSIPNDYNMDDELVTDNELIENQGIRAIPQLFSNAYYQDEMGYQYGYRPFTLATFAIEQALFGDNPYLSHFVNVLLYSLLVILIFITLCKLFPSFNWVFPATVALLFAAHPIHTEAVASIKNREEILALLGGLGSLFFIARIAETGKWYYYLFIPLVFFAGVLSKKSAVSFAFTTPLAGVVLMGLSIRQVMIISIPLGAVTAFLIPLNLLLYKVGFGAIVAMAPLLFSSHFWQQVLIYVQTRPKKLYHFVNSYILQALQRFLQSSQKLMKRIFRFLIYPFKEPALENNIPGQIGIQNIVASVLLLGSYAYIMFLPSMYWLEVILILIGGVMVLIHQGVRRHFWLAMVFLILLSYSLIYGYNIIPNILLIVSIIQLSWVREKKIQIIYSSLLVLTSISVGVQLVIDNSLLSAALQFGGFLLLYGVLFWILIKYRNQKKGLYYIITYIASLYILGSALILITSNTGFLNVLTAAPVVVFHMVIFGLAVFNRIQLYARLISLSIAFIVIFFWSSGEISSSDYFSKWQRTVYHQEEGNQNPDEPLPNPQTDRQENFNPLNIGQVQSPNVLPKEGRKSLTYNENPIQHHEDNQAIKYGISFYSLGYYLKQLVFPHPLHFYYGYAKIPVLSLTNGWALVSAILYLGLGVCSLLFLRKYPVLCFGLLTFLASIAVFSNIVAPVAGIMGERLAFTASLGFCIVLAWLLVQIFKLDVTRSRMNLKDLPLSFLIVTGLILALYSGKTFSRNFKWENRITLMQHDIKHLENSSIANSLYAKNLMATLDQLTPAQRQQRIVKAEKHLKKAIDIYPDFFNNWYDLGRIYLMQKQYDRALETFQRAIEVDSSYPKTYMKIAAIYQKKGNREKEFEYVKEAFNIQPSNEKAGTYLGDFYLKQDQMEKAIDVLQRLVNNAPNSYRARKKLGRVYFQSKRYKQAAQTLENAYQIRQNDYELVLNLSEIYRKIGNNRKAEFYAKRARQLKSDQRRN